MENQGLKASGEMGRKVSGKAAGLFLSKSSVRKGEEDQVY